MDEFCDGAGRCLPRSYEGGFFADLPTWDFTPSFVYDDALVVIAYTARGLPDDLRRARTIGDTLLFVQENDPIGDGRTRASYEPHGIRQGRVGITGPGAFTGKCRRRGSREAYTWRWRWRWRWRSSSVTAQAMPTEQRPG